MTKEEFLEKYQNLHPNFIKDVNLTFNTFDKEYYFQYMICKLVEWELQYREENTFTALKAILMVFLVASMDTYSKNSLLDIFNNFVAWPYGPQEKDLKNIIVDKKSDLEYICFEHNKAKVKKSEFQLNHITRQIDTNIEWLYKKNKHIVKLYPMDLTSLLTTFYSWQVGSRTEDKNILVSDIRKESKQFSLDLF